MLIISELGLGAGDSEFWVEVVGVTEFWVDGRLMSKFTVGRDGMFGGAWSGEVVFAGAGAAWGGGVAIAEPEVFILDNASCLRCHLTWLSSPFEVANELSQLGHWWGWSTCIMSWIGPASQRWLVGLLPSGSSHPAQ